MAVRNPTSARNTRLPRIADRLAAARRGRFVGRADELELFRSALTDTEPPFAVLYLYGPGGIGKTTLLREYAGIAEGCQRPVLYLDGRNLDPTPTGLLMALCQHLDLEDVALAQVVAHWPHAGVLLIDTYETLTPLDTWLRETFLPELPAQSLAVIASRTPPESAWRTDIAWSGLARLVPLRDLCPAESQRYLGARGIPDEQHADVLAFTHGHPLALTLVADALSRGDRLTSLAPFYEPEPDVVHVLLERLMQDVPSDVHREALQICVRMWATTETLLDDILGETSDVPTHELYEWLRSLSFIEQGPYGLYPHDLAREVLDADWRWRNPGSFRQMTRRLFTHAFAKFAQSHGAEQQRVWFYMLYLCRHSPKYRPYYEWSALGSAFAEPATPDDYPALLAMIERHQGAASVQIARYWLARQPEAFQVLRTVDGDIFGMMASLHLYEISDDDCAADPAMLALRDFVQGHGPLRSGEGILYLRFPVTRDGNLRASPAMNLFAVNTSIAIISFPRLAWNFIAHPDPEYIEPHFTSFHFWRTPDADFTVGGLRYGLFAHDWRVEPPMDWLDVKARLAADPNMATQQAVWSYAPSLLVLSQPEFAEAARQALRDFTCSYALAINPLLRSRLVMNAANAVHEQPTAATLQALLREAVASLTEKPRDMKFHRAIWHTYIEPAPTQERAAELLGLPFNTYRYHLANGIDRVSDWLWQRELQEM